MTTYAGQYAQINTLQETVPQFEWQKIENLICPPALKPAVANPIITQLNTSIQNQYNQIQNLINQVNDLESRYRIQFSVGNVNVYAESATHVMPQVTVTGSLPNPQLNFTIIQAKNGPVGMQGPKGPIGPNGMPGTVGQGGVQGYWGIQG